MKLLKLPFRFLAWVFEPLRPVTFGEVYWHEVERLLPLVDAADRPQVLASAAQANLGAQWVARLRQARCAVTPGDPRTLSLEQLDRLAKDRARTSRGGELRSDRLFSLPFRLAALLLVIAAAIALVAIPVGFANGTLP